jgi:ribosomal protein L11 methylase PrmA
VATHVYLHSKLQSSTALDATDTGKSLRAAGFHKEMIRNNAARLIQLVKGLQWAPASSTWSGYADANSYSDGDRDCKVQFVREVVQETRRKLVWDLGCNTGTFSRIAAENSDYVIALDADHLAVERLYQSLKAEGGVAGTRVLPLVGSVVDQSAGLGWRGAERRSLAERGRPNLTLCLALVHHLVIGHGVPVGELLSWLAALGSDLVIEYVAKDDPMVRRLLRGRTDNYSDYEADVFENLLGERFTIQRREELPSGTRVLYYAVSRGTA